MFQSLESWSSMKTYIDKYFKVFKLSTYEVTNRYIFTYWYVSMMIIIWERKLVIGKYQLTKEREREPLRYERVGLLLLLLFCYNYSQLSF